MAWQGSHSTGFPAPIRAQILQRDPTCRCLGCELCDNGCTRPSTEADHLVSVAAGGSNDPGNGQGLCAWCHQRKTVHEATAARARRPRATRPTEAHPGLT